MLKMGKFFEYSESIRSTNTIDIKKYYLKKFFNEIKKLIKIYPLSMMFFELEKYKESHKEDFDLIYRFFIDVFMMKNIVYSYDIDLPQIKCIYVYDKNNDCLKKFDNEEYMFNFLINNKERILASYKDVYLNQSFPEYNNQIFDFIYKQSLPMAKFMVDNQLYDNNIFVNVGKLNVGHNPVLNVYFFYHIIGIYGFNNQIKDFSFPKISMKTLRTNLENDYFNKIEKDYNVNDINNFRIQ